MAGDDPGRRQKEAGASASARYFCTAGRGMEPFLLREVGARLGASEVECVLGKVFFTTSAELTKLKKLKSAERLFLVLNKSPPIPITRNKGKIIHDINRLVNGNPRCWLDVVTAWQNLQMKPEHLCQKSPASNKRKLEDEKNIKHKKQKGELGETVPAESQTENQQTCETSEAHKENVLSQDTSFLETDSELTQERSIEKTSGFTFRVSCRISGAIAKSFTSQDMGRIIGIAVMKSFGWKADLRNPDIEIFVHLNDIYTVIGIPVFRLPLASRTYIKTAGLRSTVAWAMASLAEIKAGDFVLDPTCGLGTVLLEAATEWPKAHYLGVDISDSQLQGAYSNIKSSSLMDKVQLLKASATVLPFSSESIDIVLADIPFGKKFKITKHTKFVPEILQELERVLCAEGIAVVLLSQELYKHFSNVIISGPEHDSHITVEPANSCTKSAIMSIMSNIEENYSSSCSVSSSAQEGEKEHITSKRIGVGSLVLVESFKVSLGKTDAFICKYKKLTASPT